MFQCFILAQCIYDQPGYDSLQHTHTHIFAPILWPNLCRVRVFHIFFSSNPVLVYVRSLDVRILSATQEGVAFSRGAIYMLVRDVITCRVFCPILSDQIGSAHCIIYLYIFSLRRFCRLTVPQLGHLCAHYTYNHTPYV